MNVACTGARARFGRDIGSIGIGNIATVTNRRMPQRKCWTRIRTRKRTIAAGLHSGIATTTSSFSGDIEEAEIGKPCLVRHSGQRQRQRQRSQQSEPPDGPIQSIQNRSQLVPGRRSNPVPPPPAAALPNLPHGHGRLRHGRPGRKPDHRRRGGPAERLLALPDRGLSSRPRAEPGQGEASGVGRGARAKALPARFRPEAVLSHAALRDRKRGHGRVPRGDRNQSGPARLHLRHEPGVG
mmetsp:Transcript_29772/g.70100  ORF Transcript_29772/g.70100 Transcript_29772/m.70100 type:complete len:239 (-) Transcript_29772:571-1287(-)